MSDMSEAPLPGTGGMAIGHGHGGNETGGNGLHEAANHYRFLADIPVRLSVEVGSVSLRLSEIMDLGEGSVVELDRQANELLDINVNGTLVARGEVVTVDGRFGIRVAEVVTKNVGQARVERRI
ncbi:flagellar motor switch protein FliN [Blastomonas sp.]|uniref:flagellar motor switch protein FliN n=1 Tax=Blastomonas sp. TaxID=1909299 RepID=UPI00359406DC